MFRDGIDGEDAEIVEGDKGTGCCIGGGGGGGNCGKVGGKGVPPSIPVFFN